MIVLLQREAAGLFSSKGGCWGEGGGGEGAGDDTGQAGTAWHVRGRWALGARRAGRSAPPPTNGETEAWGQEF